MRPHHALGVVAGFGVLIGMVHHPMPVLAATGFQVSTGVAAASDQCAPEPEHPTNEPAGQLTLTGWFTTVWGASPRYWITDDQGQRAEILLAEELARPLGGPQAFDRRRVRLTGEEVRRDPLLVRATSIDLESP